MTIQARHSQEEAGPQPTAPGLVYRVKKITGATNTQLARLLGIGESTVQAYDVGRLPERLTDEQIGALLRACRAYRDEVVKGVAELELLT